MRTYHVLKRVLDFILAFISLIVLSPVFIIISLIIKFTSDGPVFFKQRRIGKNKKEFYILKFRTMRTDTPKDMPTHLLEILKLILQKLENFYGERVWMNYHN